MQIIVMKRACFGGLFLLHISQFRGHMPLFSRDLCSHIEIAESKVLNLFVYSSPSEATLSGSTFREAAVAARDLS